MMDFFIDLFFTIVILAVWLPFCFLFGGFSGMMLEAIVGSSWVFWPAAVIGFLIFATKTLPPVPLMSMETLDKLYPDDLEDKKRPARSHSPILPFILGVWFGSWWNDK